MRAQTHGIPRSSAVRTNEVFDPMVDWSKVAEHAPDGLAVIDADGLFVQLNSAAVALCGRPEQDLVGMPAPFALAEDVAPASLGLLDDGTTEQICTWAPVAGTRFEFAYRTRRLGDGSPLTLVAFRDVTAERHRHRRVAAVARISVRLASEGSLSDALDSLAREVLQADALAGVQILTAAGPSSGMRIMGSAGFRRWPDFFERLMACRDRGATLRVVEVLTTAEPVIVPNRWQEIISTPGWEPLRDYLSELEWDWFVSVPVLVRGRPVGALNAFFAPGQVAGHRALEFLATMAEQAATAIDYAELLQNERDLVRREERQRLARDLHDSIVQQVFSIAMQAKSMEVMGDRSDTVLAESVRRIATEVGSLSKAVLGDLRAMVHELRPMDPTDLGLSEAVAELVESTANRTGLHFRLTADEGLDQATPEMTVDLYRIVAEAVHNIVKHAEATTVTIRLGVRHSTVVMTVMDDGRGVDAVATTRCRDGYGLTSMRERAERWGGTVRVRRRRPGGTTVQAVVPLPVVVVPTTQDRSA